MKGINVMLRKKGANVLVRDGWGNWKLDGKAIDTEQAILEMAEAVNDLGYWCQVAKDVLPEEEYAEVQRAYYSSENE